MFFVLIMFLLVIIGVFLLYLKGIPGKSGGGIACKMDAMQCPDGTYVGRIPPDCEFAPCP